MKGALYIIIIVLLSSSVAKLKAQPCTGQLLPIDYSEHRGKQCIRNPKYKPTKVYDYANAKYRFTDTNIVKTNGVYIGVLEADVPNKKPKRYVFYRFFSTGQCFISDEYCSMPGKEEMNDLSYGAWAYYAKIDNNIEIEKREGGYYPLWIEIAQMKGNTMEVPWYKRAMHGQLEPNSAVKYVFRPVDLNSKPEW